MILNFQTSLIPAFNRRFLRIFSVILMTLVFTNSAHANVGTFVDSIYNDVLKIMDSNGSLQSKRSEIRVIIKKVADFNSMSSFVLGHNKNKISNAEFNKFKNAYQKYLLNYYSTLFSKFQNQKFEKIKTFQINSTKTVVTIKITDKKSSKSMKIDFVVTHQGSKYLVFDIVSDGISMITSQRSEFNSIINNQGINALITKLEGKR